MRSLHNPYKTEFFHPKGEMTEVRNSKVLTLRISSFSHSDSYLILTRNTLELIQQMNLR
jgi:hypothetical protein